VGDQAETLRGGAHSLKGSSASVGARAMTALALELEKAAGLGDLASAADLVSRLEDCLARTAPALKAASARVGVA